MNPRVNELLEAMDRAQSELEDIRYICPHPSYEVIWSSWRPGCMDPTRFCLECQSKIPGITKEEDKTLRGTKSQSQSDSFTITEFEALITTIAVKEDGENELDTET